MKYPRTILLCLTLALGVTADPGPTAAAEDVLPDQEAITKFVAGGIAYKQEDYTSAISAYEEILKRGKESGALYYNLGNSYFRKGDLGKAILNYERARRLIPRDGDLNFNLEYACRLVERRIRNVGSDVPLSAEVGVPTPDALGRDVGIERWVRNWTDRELVWLLCGLGLLGAAVHLIALYAHWPVPLRRRALGVLTVLWLLPATGLFAKSAAEKNLAVAVVAGEAKFEPRADATTHFTAGEGTLLKVLATEDNWAKIRRGDGKTGWVLEKNFGRLDN